MKRGMLLGLFHSLTVFVLCDGMRTIKLPSIAFPGLAASYNGNIQAGSKDEFKKLKERQECQTDWQSAKHRSSYLYRALAYEALSKCGHPHPQVVMIVNCRDNTHLIAAGAQEVSGKKCRGINFHEDSYKNEAYGVKRLFMFHEAMHMVRKDYYQSYTLKERSQARERCADMDGVKAGGCEQCAQEFAAYWLKQLAHIKAHVDCVLRATKIIPQSVDQIYQWDIKYLDWYLQTSKQCLDDFAGFNKSTHPFHLERALYVIKLARTVLKSQACEFHMKLLIERKKKEEQQKKLLEDKKLKEALKKEKEDYAATQLKHKQAVDALLAAEKELKLKEKENLKVIAATKRRHTYCYNASDRSAWLFKQKK